MNYQYLIQEVEAASPIACESIAINLVTLCILAAGSLVRLSSGLNV